MNRSQTVVLTLCVLATVANAYGAVKRSQAIVEAVVGGFIVTIILLAIAEAEKASVIAEAFAGAFMVTSVSENGTELFTAIAKLSTNNAEGKAATNLNPNVDAQRNVPAGGAKPATIE